MLFKIVQIVLNLFVWGIILWAFIQLALLLERKRKQKQIMRDGFYLRALKKKISDE